MKLDLITVAGILSNVGCLLGIGSWGLYAQTASGIAPSTFANTEASTAFDNLRLKTPKIDECFLSNSPLASSSPAESDEPDFAEGGFYRPETPRPHASRLRYATRQSTSFGLRVFNSTFFSTARPSVPAIDQGLLAGVAAVRIEDAITTPMLFKNGAQEDILPDWVARSNVAMLSLGVFATNTQYRLSKFLIDHGHLRLARITELGHALGVGYYATQNIPAHRIYVVR